MQPLNPPPRTPAAPVEDLAALQPPLPLPTPPWRGLAPHRLRRVLNCVEARLAERIPVADLAAEASMSLFHFARMFKLATGHSPHHYVTLQRMARARELLATTRMPIAEIARAVGYQTQAHFTGVFARHVGVTPKAYRLGRRAPGEEALRDVNGGEEARHAADGIAAA